MKTSLPILVLAMTLATFAGCGASPTEAKISTDVTAEQEAALAAEEAAAEAAESAQQ